MKKILLFLLLISLHNVTFAASLQWEKTIDLAAKSFSNSSPRITLDSKGNPIIIWGRGSDGALFYSKSNGTSFSNPKQLNQISNKIAIANWMGPQIASKGDTIYIVFKQTPEDLISCHIYICSSFDGGNNFSTPKVVDNINDSISRFPTVTIDSKGNPVVGFMKFNSKFEESRWVVTSSNDFGNSFEKDVKTSGWEGAKGICDCCPGTVLSSDNVTIMLYRNNQSNIRDSWAGVSKDFGKSFTNGMNVDKLNWNLNSCPASGPDGVIIGDTLYSVFMNGFSGRYLSYFSKSVIGSNQLISTSNISNTFNGLSQQNYPRIANFNNSIAIAWKQIVNGNTFIPLIYTKNIRNGLPKNYDTLAIGNISNCDVAINESKVFAVWEDDNSGTVKITSANYVSNNYIDVYTFNADKYKIQYISDSKILKINVEEENFSFGITDLNGKVIRAFDKSNNQNSNEISAQNWNKGVYLITLEFGNEIFSEKIIIE